MSKTAHAALLDQAQQQIELQCFGEVARITTRLDQQVTTNQPMPRHQGRQALQQVQIETGTEHRGQRAIGLTLNLVYRDSPALCCVDQLGTGQQQTAAGELFTDLRQHQPVAG